MVRVLKGAPLEVMTALMEEMVELQFLVMLQEAVEDQEETHQEQVVEEELDLDLVLEELEVLVLLLENLAMVALVEERSMDQ